MNPFASLKAAIIFAKSSARSSAGFPAASALSTCHAHRTGLPSFNIYPAVHGQLPQSSAVRHVCMWAALSFTVARHMLSGAASSFLRSPLIILLAAAGSLTCLLSSRACPRATLTRSALTTLVVPRHAIAVTPAPLGLVSPSCCCSSSACSLACRSNKGLSHGGSVSCAESSDWPCLAFE